jgi:hypothetical protein
MTDAISPFLQCADSLSHTHTLSLCLCLSAILFSSPLSPFDINMLSEDFMLSMNKRILLRSVLISKVKSIPKYLWQMMMKMINYLFNFEKIRKKLGPILSISKWISTIKNGYFTRFYPLDLSTIHIYLIQIWPSSIAHNKYHNHLILNVTRNKGIESRLSSLTDITCQVKIS